MAAIFLIPAGGLGAAPAEAGMQASGRADAAADGGDEDADAG